MEYGFRLPVDGNRRSYRWRVCSKVRTVLVIGRAVVVGQREIVDILKFGQELSDSVFRNLIGNGACVSDVSLPVEDDASIRKDFKFVTRASPVTDCP